MGKMVQTLPERAMHKEKVCLIPNDAGQSSIGNERGQEFAELRDSGMLHGHKDKRNTTSLD